jgi:hypothetical protein
MRTRLRRKSCMARFWRKGHEFTCAQCLAALRFRCLAPKVASGFERLRYRRSDTLIRNLIRKSRIRKSQVFSNCSPVPFYFAEALAASLAAGDTFCRASHLCALNCCCTPDCPNCRGSAENCVLHDSQIPSEGRLLTRFNIRRLRFAMVPVSHTPTNNATTTRIGTPATKPNIPVVQPS